MSTATNNLKTECANRNKADDLDYSQMKTILENEECEEKTDSIGEVTF